MIESQTIAFSLIGQHPVSHGAAEINGRDEAARETEAFRQFEGIFLREVMKDTFSSMAGSGSASSKTASSIYSHWLGETLIDAMTQDGAFGIARTMQDAMRMQAGQVSEEKGGSDDPAET